MRAGFKTQNKKEKFDTKLEDYVDTTTKVIVTIVGDISESMSWHKGIEALNEGVNVFVDSLLNDEYAKATVEVSLYTFNHETTKIIDALPVDQIIIPPLVASGGTDISKAVFTALKDQDAKIEEYKANNIKYKAPWLVLLSDLDIVPSDIDYAVAETNERINNNKLTMFCIGCGDDVNKEELNRFSPKIPALYAPKSEDIVVFFEWLSQTIKTFSHTKKDEKMKTEPIDRSLELCG